MFFYFMPQSVGVLINTETSRYGPQQVNRRAASIQSKQVASTRDMDSDPTASEGDASLQTHKILLVT